MQTLTQSSIYNLPHRERVTQKERDAKDKQWYKDKINLVNASAYGSGFYIGYGGVTDYHRKKVNYDLYNNIINKADFEYVCRPYGGEVGDLPAELTNRDIVSGKIKVLLGMEMKMPFSWNVIATNEEASNRRSEVEFGKIRQFTTNSIMAPIETQIRQQAAEQQRGKKLSPEQQQQIEDQVQQEIQDQTPDSVRQYMIREHRDPAEVLSTQLLEYLVYKERVPFKFNKGFKHSTLSGVEVFHVGIFNGEPKLTVVNPLFFDYDISPDLDMINHGEWARCEYRLTPSQVVSQFGSELTDEEIDRVYDFQNNATSPTSVDFSFRLDRESHWGTLTVLHTVWKSLRKVGFLTYLDEHGGRQMMVVDENYNFNKRQGDIDIEWDWVPEAHEGWKILDDIYAYCRPVPGQKKDLDNLYECNLPYYGAATDHINSPTTSIMDRMKSYQYFYNIILYRIELLMASDKGKIMMMNINSIPKSAGIDTAKFLYFLEANKIGFFNPNEEGNRGTSGSAGDMAKEIDMSLISDIQKYMNMAEYLATKCGKSVGITDPVEGSAGPDEAVSNTRQNLVQSSHILQPYFEMHNDVKREVLQALLECAKVAYTGGKPRKLTYVLDDMSYQMLDLNQENLDLLDNSTYGVFVANSSKAADAKRAVEQLAQAAMQNQQADLVDIIKVIRSESIQEAEELLEVGMQKKQEQQQAAQKAEQQAQKEAQQQADVMKHEEWDHEDKQIVLRESERRKTVLQQTTIAALGWAKNPDINDNGVPDLIEVYKHGADVDLQSRALDLKQQEITNKKSESDARLQIEDKKADAAVIKAKKDGSKSGS